MIPKPVGQFVNGHPVHAGLGLIAEHSSVRTNEILRVAYPLHQVARQGSLLVEHRERLLPSMRGSPGSAGPPFAVVLFAFLLLRVPRGLRSGRLLRSPVPGRVTHAETA